MQFLMQRQEKVVKNEIKRRKLKKDKLFKTVENAKL